MRKPDQRPRKQDKKRTPHHRALEAPSDETNEEECGESEGEENDEKDTNEAQTKFSLDDWNEWLQNSD